MKILMMKATCQEFRAEYYLLRTKKKWGIEASAYCHGKLSSRKSVTLPELSFTQCYALTSLLSKHCVLPKTLEDVIAEQLDEMPQRPEYRAQWIHLPQLRNQLHS